MKSYYGVLTSVFFPSTMLSKDWQLTVRQVLGLKGHWSSYHDVGTMTSTEVLDKA